ncbi:hypothetical protein WN943_026682 [Citrus x changshan-huyou]
MAAHLGAPPPDFLSSTAAEIDEFVFSDKWTIIEWSEILNPIACDLPAVAVLSAFGDATLRGRQLARNRSSGDVNLLEVRNGESKMAF